MYKYSLTKVGNNLDQWNLYDDGVWVAVINGKYRAFKILNLLNGE